MPRAVVWVWHLLLTATFESNKDLSSRVGTPGRFFQIPNWLQLVLALHLNGMGKSAEKLPVMKQPTQD